MAMMWQHLGATTPPQPPAAALPPGTKPGVRPPLKSGAVTQDQLAAAAAAAQAAAFVQSMQPKEPKGKKQPKGPVEELRPPMSVGAQTPPPSRPLSELLAEQAAQAALAAGKDPSEVKFKPIKLVKGPAQMPPGTGKKRKAGGMPMPMGPGAMQQAEDSLWRFCSHCADLSVSESQLQKELDHLLMLRAAMMGYPPEVAFGNVWTPPPGQGGNKTTPEELKYLLAKTLSENGSHMSLLELLKCPGVAPALKSAGTEAPTFMQKFSDLFAVEEALGEAGHKTVTLIGEVPPAPPPAEAGAAAGAVTAWPGPPVAAWGSDYFSGGAEYMVNTRENLLATVLKKISENSGELELGAIGSDATISMMRKGLVANLSQWLGKHSDLVELVEAPPLAEGKPVRKLAKLTAAGWEAPAAIERVHDPEKSSNAISKLVEMVRDLLTKAAENKMKLEELALTEEVKEVRKDIAKSKKIGAILKEHSSVFKLYDAPRTEGGDATCTWVGLAII